jgi:hypothetical protein
MTGRAVSTASTDRYVGLTVHDAAIATYERHESDWSLHFLTPSLRVLISTPMAL